MYTVVYNDFEGGFWGLVSESGEKYFPIHFPEQLKYPDKRTSCDLVELKDVMTTVSWGLPCKIISFSTFAQH